MQQGAWTDGRVKFKTIMTTPDDGTSRDEAVSYHCNIFTNKGTYTLHSDVRD